MTEAVTLAPGIRRLRAANPSPLTGSGTNTYLLGTNDLAVIDPGPDLDAHLAAILQATKGRRVSAIIVTHAHRDHSALAPRLLGQGADGVGRACRSLSFAEERPRCGRTRFWCSENDCADALVENEILTPGAAFIVARKAHAAGALRIDWQAVRGFDNKRVDGADVGHVGQTILQAGVGGQDAGLDLGGCRPKGQKCERCKRECKSLLA